MADIISFEPKTSEPQDLSTTYHVDVTLTPDNLMFTINRIKTSKDALFKIASELEQIASILRSDVITKST